MKIRELELKNFGKFTSKKMKVQDGIQLFYGENESGKSTVHTFIKGMLFGLERKRGRAAATDTFHKYEPWENGNYYSGVLVFECGGKAFRLERNFDKYAKKAVLICEDDGEELSVEDGDLDVILSGIKMSVYEDTSCIGQLHTRTSRSLALEMKDYAANYYVTGDSELNLSGALEMLAKQRKDQEKEIKNFLQDKQKKREKIEQESNYLWRDIHRLEEQRDQLEEELAYRKEKEKYRKKDTKKEEAKNVIDEIRPPKWRIHPLEILFMLVLIVLAFLLISRPWNSLVAIIIALAGGIYTWNRMKEGKNKTKTPPELILEEIEPEGTWISEEKLLWQKDRVLSELREKRVQYGNLQEQLEELDEISEESKALERQRKALELACQRLEEVSADMRVNISSELNRKASEIISEITGGKYTHLTADEDLKLSLIKNGKKIYVEQLSQGTIEQIYFALRMAAGELLHEEEYPVILDDTFAFYDERRLRNTLRWLAVNKKQVLIFTCQKREEEILKNLGAAYSKIVLE